MQLAARSADGVAGETQPYLDRGPARHSPHRRRPRPCAVSTLPVPSADASHVGRLSADGTDRRRSMRKGPRFPTLRVVPRSEHALGDGRGCCTAVGRGRLGAGGDRFQWGLPRHWRRSPSTSQGSRRRCARLQPCTASRICLPTVVNAASRSRAHPAAKAVQVGTARAPTEPRTPHRPGDRAENMAGSTRTLAGGSHDRAVGHRSLVSQASGWLKDLPCDVDPTSNRSGPRATHQPLGAAHGRAGSHLARIPSGR